MTYIAYLIHVISNYTYRNFQPSGQFDSNFMAACESDKVAASRAVAQNQQLKEQLEELEIAVIQVVSIASTNANTMLQYSSMYKRKVRISTHLKIISNTF